jgi:hypothetical protein
MSISERLKRNLGTLSLEEVMKIERTSIGIAGCGLGSEAARLLVRFGFSIGALADPDVVELHNLNRQSYHHSHVGKLKVEGLLDKLRHINTEINPLLFREGITHENMEEFVASSDIIVDAIDPTSLHLSLAMTREAHRQGKAVVTSIDYGFGARLFVFPHDGMNVMDFMGIDQHTTDAALLKIPLERVMAPYMKDIPSYSLDIIMALANGELDFYPQNMLAVGQSALLITAACKRLTLGQPVISAPDFLHVDLDLLTTPTDSL